MSNPQRRMITYVDTPSVAAGTGCEQATQLASPAVVQPSGVPLAQREPLAARAVKLDSIDLQILIELQKNGRITNFELSVRVGISPSPCHKRMRRLEKAGLVTGYRAEIAWSRLFSNLTVYAFVGLRKHGLSDFQMFERHVRRHNQISACFALSGTYNYLLRFDCRDLESFVLVSKELLAQQACIERLDSHIVLSQIKDEPVAFPLRPGELASHPEAAAGQRQGALVSATPRLRMQA